VFTSSSISLLTSNKVFSICFLNSFSFISKSSDSPKHITNEILLMMSHLSGGYNKIPLPEPNATVHHQIQPQLCLSHSRIFLFLTSKLKRDFSTLPRFSHRTFVWYETSTYSASISDKRDSNRDTDFPQSDFGRWCSEIPRRICHFICAFLS